MILEYSISLTIRPPVDCDVEGEVSNTFTLTSVAFWKNSSMAVHVLLELCSSACVDITHNTTCVNWKGDIFQAKIDVAVIDNVTMIYGTKSPRLC